MDCRYVLAAPDAAQPLLRRALVDLGLCETAPNVVPGLDGDGPWCARWMLAVLRDVGIPAPSLDDAPGLASARALLLWLGTHGYSTDHAGDRRAGDVVGWERHDAAGRVIGAHVALWIGADAVIAGNSGPRADRVWVTLVEPTRVQWAARVVR